MLGRQTCRTAAPGWFCINKDARQTSADFHSLRPRREVVAFAGSGLTATSGVTLAGAEIKPGKTWRPLQVEHLASKDRQVQIEMEPGSGAALFFDGSL